MKKNNIKKYLIQVIGHLDDDWGEYSYHVPKFSAIIFAYSENNARNRVMKKYDVNFDDHIIVSRIDTINHDTIL